jgi:hypothetical protein
MHTHGGINSACQLAFTFGPRAGHQLALFVEIFTHFTESFDDSFQALAEAGSCQILIDFYSAAGRQRSAGDPDGGLKRELCRFFRVKFSEVAS